MLTKKLFALALVSALGLSVSAAQAASFNHRDSGFQQTARHGDYRGRDTRHFGHYNRYHNNWYSNRHHNRFDNRHHNRFDNRFNNRYDNRFNERGNG
jgi:hypothetical protein